LSAHKSQYQAQKQSVKQRKKKSSITKKKNLMKKNLPESGEKINNEHYWNQHTSYNTKRNNNTLSKGEKNNQNCEEETHKNKVNRKLTK
jgi:hypothetical protein